MTENKIQGLPPLDEFLNRDRYSEQNKSEILPKSNITNRIILVSTDNHTSNLISNYNHKARPLMRPVKSEYSNIACEDNEGFISYLKTLSKKHQDDDIIVLYSSFIDPTIQYISDQVYNFDNLSFFSYRSNDKIVNRYIDASCKFRSL